MKPQECMEKLRGGPYMHLFTCYKPDNVWEVDHEAMRSNLRYMIRNGAKVVDATGGVGGEWPFLTDEERSECWKDVVVEGKGKVVCIACCGHSSTKKAVKIARFCEKIGIEGLMMVAPFGQTPDEEGLYQHYKKIAEATSLGIIVYNSPVSTHRANVTPAVMERLAQIPNIIGIKEASYDMDQLLAQIRVMEKYHKVVVSGMGDEFYVVGALASDVVVSSTNPAATWDPVGVIEFHNAVQRRDMAAIARSFRRFDLMRDFAQSVRRTHPNTFPQKAALDFVEGVRGGAVRPPLEELTEAERSQLRAVLVKMDLKLKK